MTSSDALNILGLENPTTRQEIQQSFRKLAKKYHPDQYHNAGASEAWATRKFIEIKEAYDLLMSPAAASVILKEYNVPTGGDKDSSSDVFTEETDISAKTHAESSYEEEFKSVSITSWLFERLHSISEKWRIIEEILDILFVLVLPCIMPALILGLLTYGSLYLFMHEILKIRNKRSIQIITRILLILELSLVLIWLSNAIQKPTIFAYIGGVAIIVSLLLMFIDLLCYLISSLWKRSVVADLNAMMLVKSHYSQYEQDISK